MSDDNLGEIVVPENIIAKLKKLDCPFLVDKEDLWLQNVLFSRPEYYQELLDWIAINYHGDVRVFPQDENVVKYLIQDLKLNDIKQPENTKHEISKANQKYFNAVEKLLDIFLLKVQLQDDFCTKSPEERLFSSSLRNKYESAVATLDEIAKKSVCHDFFPTAAPLLLREIEDKIESRSEEVEEKNPNYEALQKIHDEQVARENKLHLPDRVEAIEVTTGIPLNLENELLELETQLRTVQNSLLESMQAFDSCYEQLKPLLGKEQKKLSDLGERFDELYQSTRSMTKLLESFCKIDESCSKANSLKENVRPTPINELLPNYFGDEPEKNIKILDNM